MAIQQYSSIWQAGTFPHIRQWLEERPQQSVFSGLAGSADAWLIADLHASTGRPLLVCVENTKRAEQLAQECATFVGGQRVCLFPSRDAIPYNMKSPFGPTTEARLRALSRLLDGDPCIFIAPHAALIQKVPPARTLFNRVVRLRAGTDTPIQTLAAWLTDIGFRRENLVTEVGTFSVRGGIVDIYPFLSEYPLRCEFWGDTLESIREFDVFSQKSVGTRESADVFPMREFCFSAADIDAAVAAMRERCANDGTDAAAVHTLEHQWKSAGDLEGMEWFLHHFPVAWASCLDYASSQTILVWDDLLGPDRRFAECAENYVRHRERVPLAVRHLVSAPEELLVAAATVAEELSLLTTVFTAAETDAADAVRYRCRFSEQPHFAQNIELFIADLTGRLARNERACVFSQNQGHAERIVEILDGRAITVPVHLGYLATGFVEHESGAAWYCDSSLFGQAYRRAHIKKHKAGEPVTRFDELQPGDYVVHVDHGIARFVGVERVHAENSQRDCMVLQYEERARLYVPVEDFHKVQKYIGKESVAPQLSTLGSAAWERIKAKTRESLREMAQELVELYAKRQYMKGIAFAKDSVWQKEFEDAFLYEETPDQLRAVTEVKFDMEQARPMDRLICGDVGFGKTEVAMRAAFKAVMAGYQVAVLAPTTILVAQHEITFRERMANFPVRIDMLSRFRTPSQQKETAAKIRSGQVDIVIGTHRLLSQDIAFKNLGLLVVDEEQRFGVRHKERLKQLRFEVDVLSMSATPIPRTLHMSLIGSRDLSVINTPPLNRLPIETSVSEFHDELLKNAIEDELDRGGQVYLVDNRIRNLYLLREKVEALVPRARAVCAHGQMDEKELELIMREFVAGRFDVLIATTIIENGLDIPNVNTILINRADALGLSQLYQLRGRVGRSSEQAYAHLLTPPFKQIGDVSLKRLRALEQYTDLGSGFQIAMRDLEIRGAGNILGLRQHGFIAAVGFELYCRLLRQAIEELQGNRPAAEEAGVKIEVDCEAYIPTGYVSDPSARISLYQQLSSVKSPEEINDIRDTVVDRFGPLPDAILSVFLLIKLRLAARSIGAQRLRIDRDGVMSLFFEGEEAAVRARVQALVAAAACPFEIISEQPVRVKTVLGSAPVADRMKEAVGLLGPVAASAPAGKTAG